MNGQTARPRGTAVWLLVGLVVVGALVGISLSAARHGGAAAQTTTPASASTPSREPADQDQTPSQATSAGPTAEPSQTCSQDDPCADAPLPVEPDAQVTVLVTSSGWEQGRSVAWVAADIGVLDPSGTCTATLRRGASTVVQEASAEPGPVTTTCAVEVAGDRLGAGEWLVSLSYLSEHHSGAAPDVSIKVP